MNTIHFVLNIVNDLKANNIHVWLFGGRAEELHQTIKPRSHKDIDLLYPCQDSKQLEYYSIQKNIIEIKEKRLAHKRAYIIDNIMVEFFLVQTIDNTLITNFYNTYKYIRPQNTLQTISYEQEPINIASIQALEQYRAAYKIIHQK